MAAAALEVHAPRAAERDYLDTSAVFSLMWRQAAAAGQYAPPQELARAQRLMTFLERLRQAGATACTTVLTLEELAAATRNAERMSAARAARHPSWQAFRRAEKPQVVARADTVARAKMLAALTWAKQALAAASVELDYPVVHMSQSMVHAEDVRKGLVHLLNQFQGIDAMDAVHLTLGVMMGSRVFVSFDMAWRAVTNITVCY